MTDISSELIDRIVAQAVATPDVEVCGLLFGSAQAITGVQPCRNVADDPTRWFELDPAALLAAHRAARHGGPPIAGHYHSHPTGVVQPSPRDAAAAMPDGALWLIVGAREVRAWRAVDKGSVEGRFEPVELIVR